MPMKFRALQKKLGVDDNALAEAQTIFIQSAALTAIRELLSSYGSEPQPAPQPVSGKSAPPVSLQSSQFITITQSVSIGGVLFPAGSHVQLVSREGSEVHVRYIGGEYTIPISATDLK